MREVIATIIGVSLIVTGCADGPSAPELIASIEIPVTCTELQSTSSCQLVSKVSGAKGSVLTDRPVTWTSSDTSVLRVNATGLVSASVNRTGVNKSGTILATSAGKTASLTIRVQPAPIERIEIIQSDTAAFPGDSVRMEAVLLSSTGDTLSGRTVKYITSDTTVGRVRTAPWIHVEPYSGATNRTLTVLVTAETKQVIRTISVRALIPASVKLILSDTIQKSGAQATVAVLVRDSMGVILTGHHPTLTSSDTTVATVIGNTVAMFSQNRGSIPRSASLSLVLNSLRDSARVLVLPEGVEQVVLSIDNARLNSRESTRLRTRIAASDGSELFGREVIYASDDTSVASVNAEGVVFAKANRGTIARSATLKATVEAKTSSLLVSVAPALVAAIELQPGSDTPYPGDTVTLASLFLSQDTDTLVGRSASYTSSDTAIAQITSHGTVAVKPYDGNDDRRVVITAQSGNVTGSRALTVRALPASAIVFPRDTIVLGTEDSRFLELAIQSASGRLLTGRSAVYTVQDTTVAYVINGVLVTKKHTNAVARTTSVIASLGPLRDTLTVIVESITAGNIVTSGDTIVMYPSQRDTIRVTVYDPTGQRLDGRAVEWSIADSTVATVQGGIVVAKPFGGNIRRTTTVTASTLGAAKTILVSVEPARVWRIQLEPVAVELFPGDTTTLRVRLTDEAGTFLADRRLTWSSSRPDVVEVDSTGLVTVRVGSAANVVAVAISVTSDAVTGTSSIAVKPISGDKAVVEITMNWDAINSTSEVGLSALAQVGLSARVQTGRPPRAQATAVASNIGSPLLLADNVLPLAITHVGARLIYPADNAAFSQSTTRVQAETNGVITLEVPPTDSAVLWVVFANETSASPSILSFGVKQKVRIERGKRLEIPIDSLIISSATWRITGSDTARLYSVDSISQNRDSTFHNLWIEATDPFQVNQSPTESQKVVSFSGSGGSGSNTTGWRRIRINSRNPRIGVSHRDSTYTFQPYVVGSLFNLAGTRYHFGAQGRYRPFWDSNNPVATANPSFTSTSVRFADSVLVTFSPRDADGNTYLTPRTIAWTSSDTTIAVGRGTGFIIGRRTGTATLSYILGGSGGAAGQISVTVLPSGRVVVPIDWTKINENRTTPVTSVGGRLTYRGRSIAYVKSVVRPAGVAESSLEWSEVAAGDSVSLWLVYTNEKTLPSGGPDHTAQAFGIARNFRISEGGTVVISPDTIALIAPSWKIPNAEDERLYLADSLYANRDLTFHYLNIEASDPFHSGENPRVVERAIRFSGSGSELGNLAGWRTFRITSRNPKVGATHRDATFTFRPYVVSELFGLPGANRYHFGAQGRFQPFWVEANIRFTTPTRQPTLVVGQQQTYAVEALWLGKPIEFRATFTVSDTAMVNLRVNSSGTEVILTTTKSNYLEGTRTVLLIAQSGLLRDTVRLNVQSLGASSEGVKTVTFSSRAGCALHTDDKIRCWGTNSDGELGNGQAIDAVLKSIPQPIASSETFTDVKAGIGALVCGLTGGGDVYCWGKVTAGSLGNGTLMQSSTPVRVQSSERFKEIAVTSNNGAACALDMSGGAWCWGANSLGELGDSSQVARPLPVRVKQPEPFRSISAFNGACAIGISGAVYCWGNRNYAGNGDTTSTIRSVPQQVLGLDTAVVKLVPGGSQVCALMRDGTVYCWGAPNRSGDGTTLRRGSATKVQFDGTFVDLSHLSTVTCGLASDAKTYCWGSSGSGQAGNGTLNSGNLLSPTLGASGLPFTTLTSGSNAGCGKRADGSWFCWGMNTGGKLGDGSLTTRPRPIALPIP